MFDRRLHTTFQRIPRYLGAYITDIDFGPDGQSVVASLTDEYRLRTFLLNSEDEGVKVVVDLLADAERQARCLPRLRHPLLRSRLLQSRPPSFPQTSPVDGRPRSTARRPPPTHPFPARSAGLTPASGLEMGPRTPRQPSDKLRRPPLPVNSRTQNAEGPSGYRIRLVTHLSHRTSSSRLRLRKTTEPGRSRPPLAREGERWTRLRLNRH